MQSYFWWVAAVIFFAAEIVTPGAVLVFAGLSAVCVALLSVLGIRSIFVECSLFVVLSIFFTYFMRPFWMRIFNGKYNLKTGALALVDREALVVEEINYQKQTGRVKIGADEFPAKSADRSVIVEGHFAVVKKIQGITLVVSEKETYREK